MNWEKIGKKLLFLPGWLVALLALVSAVLLTMVFLRGWEQQTVAYAVYVLSFYALTVATLYCILILPKQLGKIKGKIKKNPIGNRYLTDRVFRGKVSLHIALGINLGYVAVNLWFWQLNRSWWYVVLAVYYVIMVVMRFLLVRYVGRNTVGKSLLGEWKRSRLCAGILLLVNLSLSGAILMILYRNRGYNYPGITIYAMALYTFYSATHAIVDIIQYRKLGSPVMSTAKIISLSAALVSVLNLETAMLAQFGTDLALRNQQIMIILTGAGISVTVVTLSVILIVTATKEIRSEKYGTK